MELRTKRFVLRDFIDGDAPAFISYHKDSRLIELYGPGENTQSHAAELVQLFMDWAIESPRLNYQLAVTFHNGLLLGCCGLRMQDSEPGKAEFGVELAPSYWGRFGYALEIMATLIDFGFTELSLDEIYGKTVNANRKITRIAKRFGATPEEIHTPEWMVAKDWKQLQWRISRQGWLNAPRLRWL